MDPKNVTKHLNARHTASKDTHTFDYLTSNAAVELYKSGVSFEVLKGELYNRIRAKELLTTEFKNIEKGKGRDNKETKTANELTISTTERLAIFQANKPALEAFTQLRYALVEGIEKEDDNRKDSYAEVLYLMSFDPHTLRQFFIKQVSPMFASITQTQTVAPAMNSLKEIKELY